MRTLRLDPWTRNSSFPLSSLFSPSFHKGSLVKRANIGRSFLQFVSCFLLALRVFQDKYAARSKTIRGSEEENMNEGVHFRDKDFWTLCQTRVHFFSLVFFFPTHFSRRKHFFVIAKINKKNCIFGAKISLMAREFLSPSGKLLNRMFRKLKVSGRWCVNVPRVRLIEPANRPEIDRQTPIGFRVSQDHFHE